MLAVSCRHVNDADGEIAALAGLLKLEPTDSGAHRRCGELLFEREAFCDAEPHLRAAARAFPEDAAIWRLLAHCLRVAEKPRDESPVLRRLIALDDDDIAAHRRLAEILLAEGASEEGLVHLRRCVALAPTDTDSQRALAEALSVSQTESGEAAAAWARLVELAPGDLIARRRLADAYFETARYPDAEAIYQMLAEASPGDPDLWRKRVQAARALRGAEGEEGVLRLAIAALSDPGEFLYALAALRVEVDAEDGVETMRAAWNAHRDPSQYAGLCGKLVEAHRVDAAITEYTMLLHEAPQSFAGWLGLGDIMSRTERHRLAATYFGKAYEISGESSHCKRWIGSLLLAGAFETIERNCAALSEEALGDENMQSQYAQALAGLGRFEEARKIAETSYHPPDDQLREGFLRYLALRARPKTSIDSPETSKSPAEQMALQAEARQARGDLSGAAQIYRAGGAALRRCFAHISADGAEVSGPDFLIIGAPRSGSSWLKNCLKRHPQLRVAQGEPGYFSAFPHFSPAIYAKRLGLIDPPPASNAETSGTGRPIFGEKTPEYLTLPDDAIELCAALYPDMRIICLVREPVARAWSHLKHRQLAARDAGFYRDEEGKIPQWLSRLLEFGRYERNLKRWARRFPANQFLIADFDSIRTDPLGLLDHVQEFLAADKTDFSELALDAEKLVGATAALAPPPDIERLLTEIYEGGIYDAALLHRTIGEAAGARGEASKAA
jgi:tetratricopeptide (TPR) repeat protein